MQGEAAQDATLPPSMSEAERKELLPRMLAALGLDEHSTARDHPEVLASLRVACALCGSVERCVTALDQGSAGTAYTDFCLNAPVLRAVIEYDQLARPGKCCGDYQCSDLAVCCGPST
jgi:hypothetical protein